MRVIDVFVDELDLRKLGFERVDPAATGRPGYSPATRLKIYVYGHLHREQSSRLVCKERRQTVELVFGPLAACMGARHFLTGTLPRVRTEISLQVLAYHLKRAIRILDAGPLMAATKRRAQALCARRRVPLAPPSWLPQKTRKSASPCFHTASAQRRRSKCRKLSHNRASAPHASREGSDVRGHRESAWIGRPA